jgi:adenosylcobinamide-phosphate synthase
MLAESGMIELVLSILLALTLDYLLGEPRRFHPLVGFGNLANALEKRFYADSRLRGVLVSAGLLVTIVAVFVGVTAWIDHWVADGVILYLALGWRSLISHALRVRDALNQSNIDLARRALGDIVSRETKELDPEGIAKASIESVLENGSDAIFSAIFWFVIAGVPGVVFYRLANTLDAMWGYRHAPYTNFGWAAARLDDLLNYIPARLTALSYALAGKFMPAIRCWRKQGNKWISPNAGPVMAAGAGSLEVILGGSEVYHGRLQSRIELGVGRKPDVQDISHAIGLVNRSLIIWLGLLLMGATLKSYA